MVATTIAVLVPRLEAEAQNVDPLVEYAAEMTFILRASVLHAPGPRGPFTDPGPFRLEIFENVEEIPGYDPAAGHALGVYNDTTWTIYIRSGLDIVGNPCARAVFVHELTHHAQMHALTRLAKEEERNLSWLKRENWSLMEHQARRVQSLWLGVPELPPIELGAESNLDTCLEWIRDQTPAWRQRGVEP